MNTQIVEPVDSKWEDMYEFEATSLIEDEDIEYDENDEEDDLLEMNKL